MSPLIVLLGSGTVNKNQAVKATDRLKIDDITASQITKSKHLDSFTLAGRQSYKLSVVCVHFSGNFGFKLQNCGFRVWEDVESCRPSLFISVVAEGCSGE